MYLIGDSMAQGTRLHSHYLGLYPFFHLLSLQQHLLYPQKDLWVGSNRQGFGEGFAFLFLSLFIPILYIPPSIHTSYTVKLDCCGGVMGKGYMWSVQYRRIKTALGIRVCSGDPRKVFSLHEENTRLWNTQSFSSSPVPGVGSIVMFAGGGATQKCNRIFELPSFPSCLPSAS